MSIIVGIDSDNSIHTVRASLADNKKFCFYNKFRRDGQRWRRYAFDNRAMINQ